MTRKIFLDTETTGLSFKEGHRIIEIAAIEMINRKLTGRKFHSYLNPQRKIDQEAINIHKIQNEFLKDKPLFSDIVDDFLIFIGKSDLIIHNANFDIGFLNNELNIISHKFGKIDDNNNIIDSLELARQKYVGKKNSLDALCKRFGIDYTERKDKGHGAELDSKILYDVYICMTSKQMSFNLEKKKTMNDIFKNFKYKKNHSPLLVVKATKEELEMHENFFLNTKSSS